MAVVLGVYGGEGGSLGDVLVVNAQDEQLSYRGCIIARPFSQSRTPVRRRTCVDPHVPLPKSDPREVADKRQFSCGRCVLL